MLSPLAMTAAVLAGSAAMLLCRPSRTPVERRPRALLVVAALACGGGLVITGAALPVLLLGGVAAAGLGLRARARRRMAAADTSARIQLACDGLATSLAAGVPVETALEAAASDWSPLAVVTGSVRLGGSVPTGLRELADTTPGAGDLRLVAAAWQVAERGGAGLAPAVASVAAMLRRRQATRRLVRSELASARATARLLAGLPVLTLLLGSGLGGDPARFLVASAAGLSCLAGGLLLGLAGLWWIEAIAGSVEAEP